MPEPGGGDRLEVVASYLILVELQYALRQAHMHISEAHVADPRQVGRRGGFGGRGFQNPCSRLRHSGGIVCRRHFADRRGGFAIAAGRGLYQSELKRPARTKRLQHGDGLLGIAVKPIDLGGVGRVIDDELLERLQMLAHRKRHFDASQCTRSPSGNSASVRPFFSFYRGAKRRHGGDAGRVGW